MGGRALIGTVVQARMTSARLPGKVLSDLAGRPLLGWVIERLERAERPAVLAVATSADQSDDPVARFCAERGVRCHRGPLEDVAARLTGAAQELGLTAVARISGDSPLIDPALVDRGVGLFEEGGADLVTNVNPRTFPPGQSVEVISIDALRSAAAEARGDEREHVTLPLYRAPERYSIRHFESGRDYGGLRLTLDTEEDRVRLEAIIGRMERPHWEYGVEEIAELA